MGKYEITKSIVDKDLIISYNSAQFLIQSPKVSFGLNPTEHIIKFKILSTISTREKFFDLVKALVKTNKNQG